MDPSKQTIPSPVKAMTDNNVRRDANTDKDTDSLAPLVHHDEAAKDKSERRKSWFDQVKHEQHSKPKEHKKSIADSGPLIFQYSPALGKEVLVKNPHWPNEDSWIREREAGDHWAFGSMAGQQSTDFGGTV